MSFTFAFVSCNVKTKATAGSTDSLSSLLFPYLGHRLALFLPDDRDDGDIKVLNLRKDESSYRVKEAVKTEDLTDN